MKYTDERKTKKVLTYVLVGLYLIAVLYLSVTSPIFFQKSDIVNSVKLNFENEKDQQDKIEFGLRRLGVIDENISLDRKCFLGSEKSDFWDDADNSPRSYYFVEFEVANGRVRGYYEFYPHGTDSEVGEFVGYSFSKDGQLFLELNALGIGEGERFYTEKVFSYYLENGELYLYWSSTLFENGRYFILDKSKLKSHHIIPEVDCKQYDVVYEDTSVSRYAEIQKSESVTVSDAGILGYWGMDSNGNANFKITDASVEYLETFYFYDLGSDDKGWYIDVITESGEVMRNYYTVSSSGLRLDSGAGSYLYGRYCPEDNDLCEQL